MTCNIVPASGMNEEWRKLGIQKLVPGFYDHPCFIEAENNGLPYLLDVYASYVATAMYSESYLACVSRTINDICEYLHRHLAQSRSLGMCMFASQMLSRMLDEEGIWNFVTSGGFQVERSRPGMPQSIYSFPPRENRELHIFEGHGWVVAPPFPVVDLTAWLQAYPEYDFPDKSGPIIRNEVQIIDVDLFPDHVRRGPYAEQFPAFQIRDNEVLLQYVPYATRPSKVALSELDKPEFLSGDTPYDIYRNWAKTQIIGYERLTKPV